MWVESLTPDFSETQVFDGELKILKVHMLKQVIVILEPFFSFMLFFQPHEIHRMLAFMLDPRYKELRLVIDYVGKEWALRIVGEYDKQVLFPLLVWHTRF